ncbi:Pentatricopeptide repeat-containing protein At2g31400 [Durusdinium trenchii]|uniref:Chloroplastic n=1 Tax=Durusdinium trenchii TaxID=1381693 RepID=A0ABP0RLJ8_9DINO
MRQALAERQTQTLEFLRAQRRGYEAGCVDDRARPSRELRRAEAQLRRQIFAAGERWEEAVSHAVSVLRGSARFKGSHLSLSPQLLPFGAAVNSCARELLSELPNVRLVASVVVFNSVITACERGRPDVWWDACLRLLASQLHSRIMPDVVGISSSIRACTHWPMAVHLLNQQITNHYSYNSALSAAGSSANGWATACSLLLQMRHSCQCRAFAFALGCPGSPGSPPPLLGPFTSMSGVSNATDGRLDVRMPPRVLRRSWILLTCGIGWRRPSSRHSGEAEAPDEGVDPTTVEGTAQWSRAKVQQVNKLRLQNIDLTELDSDIETARKKPCTTKKLPPPSKADGGDGRLVWCIRCLNWQERACFSRQAKKKNGLRSYCRRCDKELQHMRISTLRGHLSNLCCLARRRDQKCSLDLSMLLKMLKQQEGRCYYSGIPLQYKKVHADWRLSLERLDNALGYTKENTVLVCAEFNTPDNSRNKAVEEVFGTAQWSRAKVEHVWGCLKDLQETSISSAAHAVPERSILCKPESAWLPDLFSYTASIGTEGLRAQWQRCLELLQEMEESEVLPNSATVNSVIEACERSCQWQLALLLLWAEPRPTAVTFSAAMMACVQGSVWLMALRLLTEVPQAQLRRDLVLFGSGLAAAELGGAWRSSLDLLQMSNAEVGERSVITHSSALTRCPWAWAMQLLGEMPSLHLQADMVAQTSALLALADEAQWPSALALLDGDGAVRASPVTFSAVLRACEDRERHLQASLADVNS